MKPRITKRLAPVGHVAVTKPTAKECYLQGIDVIIAGDNVNHYHILDGWHLGLRVNRSDDDDATFEQRLNNFLFYLEPELGRYAVFYVNRLPL